MVRRATVLVLAVALALAGASFAGTTFTKRSPSYSGSPAITGPTGLTLTATTGTAQLVATAGEADVTGISIDVNATAGIVDLDATGNITLDTSAGTWSIDGTGACNATTSGAVSVIGGTTATLDANGGSVSVIGSTDVVITAEVDDVLITAADELDLTSAGIVDVNGGGGIDVDATGALALDATTSIVVSSGTTSEYRAAGTMTIRGSAVAIANPMTYLATCTAVTGTATLTEAQSGSYIVDTGNGATEYTVSLPATPTTGTHFVVTRNESTTFWLNPGASTAIIYSVGKMDDDEDLSITVAGTSIHLVYDGADWVAVTETDAATFVEATP